MLARSASDAVEVDQGQAVDPSSALGDARAARRVTMKHGLRGQRAGLMKESRIPEGA